MRWHVSCTHVLFVSDDISTSTADISSDQLAPPPVPLQHVTTSHIVQGIITHNNQHHWRINIEHDGAVGPLLKVPIGGFITHSTKYKRRNLRRVTNVLATAYG